LNDDLPALRRVRWLAAALAEPSGVEVEDIERAYDVSRWSGDWSYERELEFFRDGRHAPSRPLTVERESSAGPDEATVVLSGADGKSWTVTCWVEPDDLHRIVRARVLPTPPEGLEIRLAVADDAEALGALERRAPIRLGHDPITFMSFDHGDDYFAPGRLMNEVTIYIAEVEGEVAGAYCGAVQPVHLDGEAKRLFLEHHVRIDPATRRGAVFWALFDYGRDRYAQATDSIAFYVSVDNLAVRKFVEGVPPWSVQPLRALLRCPDPADAEPLVDGVEPATAADAEDIAAFLNECHDQAALYVPYTGSSISERLSRDPDQYGWTQMRRTVGAAVGVSDQLVRVIHSREGTERHSVRALALDHGFRPGCEDEYRALLRSWCRELGGRGATHLAVFTSERSSTFSVLSDLADDIEVFDFWAFELDEPASLASHGFYVDAIYF